MNIKLLFRSPWWKTTLLVLIAVGVLVRLGIWQLDRLDQRQAFNARIEAQWERPPLHLNDFTKVDDLVNMEYRWITVVGEYDHTNQVALRNQVWNNILGVHLLTPLQIAGTDHTILVNRGWILMEDFTSGNWEKFDEVGLVEVKGMIRNSQSKPEIGRISDPVSSLDQEGLTAWNLANLDHIGQQIPYSILPVYVQQAPDPSWNGLPHRSLPDLDLTEGSHLGYAIQWFTFAAILGFGYPYYIQKESEKVKGSLATKAKSGSLENKHHESQA